MLGRLGWSDPPYALRHPREISVDTDCRKEPSQRAFVHLELQLLGGGGNSHAARTPSNPLALWRRALF